MQPTDNEEQESIDTNITDKQGQTRKEFIHAVLDHLSIGRIGRRFGP